MDNEGRDSDISQFSWESIHLLEEKKPIRRAYLSVRSPEIMGLEELSKTAN